MKKPMKFCESELSIVGKSHVPKKQQSSSISTKIESASLKAKWLKTKMIMMEIIENKEPVDDDKKRQKNSLKEKRGDNCYSKR